VIERGDCLGFTLETMQAVRVRRHFQRERLEGDKATPLQVLGRVDFSRAAVANRPHDAVVQKGGPNHGWRREYLRPGAQRIPAPGFVLRMNAPYRQAAWR